MSLSNARSIGSVRARSKNSTGEPPKKRVYLLDHIPAEIQDVIWLWYKEGRTRRQMSQWLVDMGVPSPPMTMPWGDNAIRVVIEKYKAKEAQANDIC
jgi:hypothetical protein